MGRHNAGRLPISDFAARPSLPGLAEKHLKGWSVVFTFAIAFYCVPLLRAHLPRTMATLCGETLSPFSIALSSVLIVLYVITRSTGLVGRLLNTRVLKHLGVISYSLYLWQQPFLVPTGFRVRYPGFLYALVCAEVSYLLIERPTFRLRGWLQPKVFAGSNQRVSKNTRHAVEPMTE